MAQRPAGWRYGCRPGYSARTRKPEGHVAECPLHFARFNVRTGAPINGPEFGRLRIPGMENMAPEFLAAMQRTGEIIGDVETEHVPTCEVKQEGDTVLVRLA